MRARDALLILFGLAAGAAATAVGFLVLADGARAPSAPERTASRDATERRIADLEAENADLRRRIETRRDRVHVEHAPAPTAAPPPKRVEVVAPQLDAPRLPWSPIVVSADVVERIDGRELSDAEAAGLLADVLDTATATDTRLELARILAFAKPAVLAAEADRLLTDTDTPAALRTLVLSATAAAAAADGPIPTSVRSIAFDTGADDGKWTLATQALLRGSPGEGRAVVGSRLASTEPARRRVAVGALAAAGSRELLPFMLETIMRDDLRGDTDALIDAIALTKDRKWSAEQLTGPPDVPKPGDLATAWAPKRQQMGEVTIELGYAQAVRPAQVRIRESLSPGAVAKIEVAERGGAWTTVWEGTAPPSVTPRWFEPSLEVVDLAVLRVRLTLDTNRVTGWNEIDAVELVGAGGLRQWAQSAAASSSYSD